MDKDLLSLSKEDLVARIRKLEQKCTQRSQASSSPGQSFRRKGKQARKFEFDKHPQRQIALKVAYFGARYNGLSASGDDDNDPSIETQLILALKRTKLIEKRDTCHVSRCGRTDAGVSAFGQVISVRVRCKQTTGKGVLPPTCVTEQDSGKPIENRPVETSEAEEIDYVGILNKVLPDDIRVLGWACVECDFSARFNCHCRTYRYFFPRSQLNIERMSDAAQRLAGEHDFRNFCYFNPDVKNYTRNIRCVGIKAARGDLSMSSDTAPGCEREMMYLEVEGNGFLYHQIRCIVGVLCLVGRELEEPSIVDALLDVDRIPGRPMYEMAIGEPLVFYHAEFTDLQWLCPVGAKQHLASHLQRQWRKQATHLAMLEGLYEVVLNSPVRSDLVSAPTPWHEHPLSELCMDWDAEIVPSLQFGKRRLVGALLEGGQGEPYEKRREQHAIRKEEKERRKAMEATESEAHSAT